MIYFNFILKQNYDYTYETNIAISNSIASMIGRKCVLIFFVIMESDSMQNSMIS